MGVAGGAWTHMEDYFRPVGSFKEGKSKFTQSLVLWTSGCKRRIKFFGNEKIILKKTIGTKSECFLKKIKKRLGTKRL